MGFEEKSSVDLGEIEENIGGKWGEKWGENFLEEPLTLSITLRSRVSEIPPERLHGNTGDTAKSGFNKQGTKD